MRPRLLLPSLAVLAFAAGCDSPTAPPAPVLPAGPPVAKDEDALTAAQQRAYLAALIAEVPVTRERVDRHSGDAVTAARYVARDGVRLCETIDRGETDAVIARQAALRFDVDERHGAAIREVTERQVCALLG